ncbi:10139_t:CDS:1 [Paraglomus brasilianum]|uniref:10139_t:CDS:1 n=1 Tax=Paraglomus brasilianum TaxID=144538 RepID=A0A9N9CJM9_9GLOM|nr:10139_t:CDS:1 [Paraglomus brasilianum]
MADDNGEQNPHSSVSSLSAAGGNFVTVTENDLTDSVSWSSASGSTELLKTREKNEFTTADDASSATAATTTVPGIDTIYNASTTVTESEDISQMLAQSETSSSSPSLSGFLEPPDSPSQMSIASDDGSIHMVNAETISPVIVSPASSLEGSHEEEDGDNVIIHTSRSESESQMRESRGEERSPQFTPTVITRSFIPGEGNAQGRNDNVSGFSNSRRDPGSSSVLELPEAADPNTVFNTNIAHAGDTHLTRSIPVDKSQPRGKVNILFQPQHRQSLVAQLNEGTNTREIIVGIIKDHILKPFLQGFALGIAAHLYRYLRSGRTSVAGVWKRNSKATNNYNEK